MEEDFKSRAYRIENRYIDEPVIVKSGQEKRRERRAKERKRKKH